MSGGFRLATDNSHIRLSYVTHFYLNQKNPATIFDLLGRYAAFAPGLLDRIHFVLVDDGSPIHYEIPPLNINYTWLKINEDIPWNQAGARNLGVVYSPSDKVLVTDIDHEFPEATLGYMINKRECGRAFYRIYRRGERTRPHPNIFLLSRARFLRFYGYDEEFAGHYGAEDYRFVKLQKYYGTRFIKMNRRYRCVERDDIDRDQSYHSLDRDLSHNTPIDRRKKQEVLAYGPDAGHSRIFLNFSWKIVKENTRNTVITRKRRPLWKHLWYWRWLFGYN